MRSARRSAMGDSEVRVVRFAEQRPRVAVATLVVLTALIVGIVLSAMYRKSYGAWFPSPPDRVQFCGAALLPGERRDLLLRTGESDGRVELYELSGGI